MDTETCKHPACSCAVAQGAEFCSGYCKTAAGDVEAHDLSECGHPQCGQ
jgi:hypothetical protein